MNFINLRISILRCPEYLGCEPTARATWLSLLAYCHEQENGGVIKDGAKWGDRQWQQIAGVCRKNVRTASPLVTISESDVLVWGYDHEKQMEVQARREQARDAARRRWNSKIHPRTSAEETPHVSRNASRIAARNAEVEVEREQECECSARVAQEGAAEQQVGPIVSHAHHEVVKTKWENRVSDEEWIAELKMRWPQVDIDRELTAAQSYVREKRGSTAALQRRFFEVEWLPRAAEANVQVRKTESRNTRVVIEDEPKGWREFLDSECPGNVYSQKGIQRWDELSVEARKYLLDRLVGWSKPLSNVEVQGAE
jgi:hypothetical protein